jgi:hypothetical protein
MLLASANPQIIHPPVERLSRETGSSNWLNPLSKTASVVLRVLDGPG